LIKADHDLEALIINDTKSFEVNTQYMSGRLAILHLSWYVVVAVGDVDIICDGKECLLNFLVAAHNYCYPVKVKDLFKYLGILERYKCLALRG